MSVVTRFAVTSARNAKRTLAALALLAVAGLVALTAGLDREGFPPINTPISIVSGTWFVDDAQAIDEEIVTEIEPAIAGVADVIEVQTKSLPNAFVAVVEFEPSVPSPVGTAAIEALGLAFPDGAEVSYTAVDAARFVGEFDLFVSVVATGSPLERQTEADALAAWLEADAEIERAALQALVTDAESPVDGSIEQRQTAFSRVALDSTGYAESVSIGIVRDPGSDLDVLAFSNHVTELLASAPTADSTITAITADFATGVQAQLDSLTANLIGGLLAVVFVGLVLIGWRAALLKAGFMLLVMLGVLVGLWAIGYTLNTITLFGLILTLGLLVDNAVVVTEAIDASADAPDPAEDDRSIGVIRTAINRVGSATLAGTLTTIVVFSPMLLIGGNLGEFVRPIPTTVIITLGLSFVLAMVAIPLAGRRLLAQGAGRAVGAPVVDAGARALSALARFSTGRGLVRRLTGLGLVGLSLASIGAGVVLAGRLDFSIFPAGKDANGLTVKAEFDPGTTVDEADRLAARIDQAVIDIVGDELVRSQYIVGNERELEVTVDLTPLGDRDTTAPEFVAAIEAELAGLDNARVAVGQIENGPPIADYPFAVQVSVDDTTVDAGNALAADIRAELLGSEIMAGGEPIEIVDAIISTDGLIARLNGERFVEVRAKYADATALTALLSTTEDQVRAFVGDNSQTGLGTDALAFDFGEESDNQDDFAALNVAGIVALVAVLALITIQFRSIVQSLLVFLAIPFSFLGVTGILTLTDNPLSFLAAIGFIALIGVSVNNTILLVDAANRARRLGATAQDAIAEAIAQRFRPLITTTLTTLAGLAPLAVADPFWESLGFTLMGGLVTSTILVLVAFPVYFVAIEAMRDTAKAVARRVFANGNTDHAEAYVKAA